MKIELLTKFLLGYGEVTVVNGVEYEIEASGVVRLEDGFTVEKGATFAVYPSCF